MLYRTESGDTLRPLVYIRQYICDYARVQRVRNVRGDGGRLREEIIEAAIEILAGLREDEVFSLRAVAKRANISAPSVYLHFDDKTALMIAVLEQLFGELTRRRDEADTANTVAGGGPWERLVARCLAYVRFALERPGHYKVLFEGRAVPRGEASPVGPFAQPLISRTAELVKALFAVQGDAIDDADRVALLLWASIHGVLSLQINNPTIDWPTAEELTLQITRALTRPAHDSTTAATNSSTKKATNGKRTHQRSL